MLDVNLEWEALINNLFLQIKFLPLESNDQLGFQEFVLIFCIWYPEQRLIERNLTLEYGINHLTDPLFKVAFKYYRIAEG